MITERPFAKKTSTIFRDKIVSVANNEYLRWRTDSVLHESDSAALNLVKKYWRTVGWNPAKTQIQDSLWQENHPWSAVFISWLMKEAGAGNRFKYSTRHSDYIVWARKNMAAKKAKPFFLVYDVCDPKAAWPEPGDLLCKNRDGKDFSLNSITSHDISHSDVVVEVDKINGYIVTIGGNLRNTVNKRIVYLDQDGFVDKTVAWRMPDEQAGNPAGRQEEFFALIKIRP